MEHGLFVYFIGHRDGSSVNFINSVARLIIPGGQVLTTSVTAICGHKVFIFHPNAALET